MFLWYENRSSNFKGKQEEFIKDEYIAQQCMHDLNKVLTSLNVINLRLSINFK